MPSSLTPGKPARHTQLQDGHGPLKLPSVLRASRVNEFVERAVVMLHEQESWLAEHGDEIRAQIDEGYAAAKSGELMDAEEARRSMERRKSA